MKNVIKPVIVIAIAVASFATLSAFKGVKKAPPAPIGTYTISLVSSNQLIDGLYCWTWSVTNPNPGNGSGTTLQDLSHWAVAFNPASEAALVTASYSFNGTTFFSTSPVMDRDPSTKLCSGGIDVLKFDVGTSGSAPTYYRVCLRDPFTEDPNTTSYIKTGGGLQGCNVLTFIGTGVPQ